MKISARSFAFVLSFGILVISGCNVVEGLKAYRRLCELSEPGQDPANSFDFEVESMVSEGADGALKLSRSDCDRARKEFAGACLDIQGLCSDPQYSESCGSATQIMEQCGLKDCASATCANE